jgi:hypothetical protein
LNDSIEIIFTNLIPKNANKFMWIGNMSEFVHVWEAEDPYRKNPTTSKPLKHEIREHVNGQFTVVSYSAFGTQTTYGPYDSLAEAQLFLLTYNRVPKESWKTIEANAHAAV